MSSIKTCPQCNGNGTRNGESVCIFCLGKGYREHAGTEPVQQWMRDAAEEIKLGGWDVHSAAAIIAKRAPKEPSYDELVEICDGLKIETDRLRAGRAKRDQERKFPCQGGPDVPYAVMAPHESMMQRNHSQTVERLSERGGLSPCEAWMVVNSITWSPSPTTAQIAEYEKKWRVFAERVNLHYEELERLRSAIESLKSERDAAFSADKTGWKAMAGRQSLRIVELENALASVRAALPNSHACGAGCWMCQVINLTSVIEG